MGRRDKRRKRSRRAQNYTPKIAEWQAKTDAMILDEPQFTELKEKHRLYVVGVMGFAGSWKRSGLKGEKLDSFVEGARRALRREFLAYQKKWAERLVISSGATFLGVLKLVYEICDEHDIPAMGVTPDNTLRYEVGQMKYLIPFGQYYGDESDVFVRTSDEFLILGGGDQSRREAIAGAQANKRVTAICGFGGAADELTNEDVPGLKRITTDDRSSDQHDS